MKSTYILKEEKRVLLEIADEPGLVRRIATGSVDLVKASLRPLKRKAVRHRLLFDFVWMYVLVFLWVHFIGYRSRYPEFHWVRKTISDSAITSVPLALFGSTLSYFSLLRNRNWL